MYAEENILANYDKLQVPVDLYQLDDNNELIVKLDKPENIHKMDIDSVKVKVTFEEIKTKVLEDVSVDFKNLNSNYKAESLNDEKVSLTLKGSMDKLNKISANDVKVWIDLSGYKPGDYELPIWVESITDIVIEPNSSKLNITITE